MFKYLKFGSLEAVSPMLSKLLGTKSDYSKIIRRWPNCTGIDVQAESVYNIYKGVVTFIGTDSRGNHVVTIQIDSKQIIRYCNLRSEYVKPNQALDEGQLVGLADGYVRVEYCTSEKSNEPCVRVATSQYYKKDPYKIFTGEQVLSVDVGSISAYDAAMSGTLYDPKDLINKDAIHPYIATVGEERVYSNFSKLKSSDVVGVMLHGGCMYDSIHLTKSKYKDTKLDTNVKNADAVEMHYGLYVDVRARNTLEARKECEELYYVVSQYPPKLGLWLKLGLVTSKSTNDDILNIYKNYLHEWGLQGQFGIYCNKSQLRQISWDKHCEHFCLWLIDSISRIDALDTLLTPDIFKV